jgi:hypothetical protein
MAREASCRAGLESTNVRNGTRSKTGISDAVGEVDIEIPRDREGTFEPQIVRKRQRRLTNVCKPTARSNDSTVPCSTNGPMSSPTSAKPNAATPSPAGDTSTITTAATPHPAAYHPPGACPTSPVRTPSWQGSPRYGLTETVQILKTRLPQSRYQNVDDPRDALVDDEWRTWPA